MATIATTRPNLRAMGRDRWGVISWLFMRVSALALIFLTLGHFAIQHVFNDVHNLSLSFVQARWANVGWRVYDAFLLSLAVVHGLNGLRIVVNDYVLDPRWNRIIKWAIVIVGTVLIIAGMTAVIGGVRKPA